MLDFDIGVSGRIFREGNDGISPPVRMERLAELRSAIFCE